MSTDRTRETLAAFLRDLSERGPFGRHFAPEVLFTIKGTDRVIAGRAAVERFIRHFHEEAFTAHTRTTLALVDTEMAYLELELVGTHTGSFRGIAATGRAIRVPTVIVFTLQDGAITTMRGHLNLTLLLQQIGIAPRDGVD